MHSQFINVPQSFDLLKSQKLSAVMTVKKKKIEFPQDFLEDSGTEYALEADSENVTKYWSHPLRTPRECEWKNWHWNIAYSLKKQISKADS